MMVYHGAGGLCVEGSEIMPARPGIRDAKGGIAFKVCVRHVAPDSRPMRPSE